MNEQMDLLQGQPCGRCGHGRNEHGRVPRESSACGHIGDPCDCPIFTTGQMLKAEGQALALSPDSLDLWRRKFRYWAGILADTPGRYFTSEDVVDLVGLPTGGRAMNANNAVGAMMNALARKGVIVKTSERRPSRRASSHGAELVVWKGSGDRG